MSVLKWDGTQGYVPIIRRSILQRQLDALDVAVELVETHRGFGAVSLLRPACEELLWLRYFNSMSPADARTLIECMIPLALLRDLKAQSDEVGEREMAAMGLGQALKGFRSTERHVREKLKELGRRLDWPADAVRKGKAPSVWFVAGATDSQRLYRFLYHATSRYVHFSPVELGRRGWGRPGQLKISSDTYEPVWALFSLSWGTRLFGLSLEASMDALQAEGVPEPPHEALAKAFTTITKVPLLPLVTPDELVWES